MEGEDWSPGAAQAAGGLGTASWGRKQSQCGRCACSSRCRDRVPHTSRLKQREVSGSPSSCRSGYRQEHQLQGIHGLNVFSLSVRPCETYSLASSVFFKWTFLLKHDNT